MHLELLHKVPANSSCQAPPPHFLPPAAGDGPATRRALRHKHHSKMSSTGGNITYDMATLTVEQFCGYHPSLALAYVALSLFALTGVAVTVLTERYRRRFVHLIR